MVKLSNRLMTAASLVTTGNVLADVGTDHGYIPIYLLEQKRIPRAIAMDINEGPLMKAREHISLYGMGEYIETRLSDGTAALNEGEAETILIAGMGGGLVMHILKSGENICRNAKELVLQPQSEIEAVRIFLAENEYQILDEEMVLEDDKFYPMMKVSYQSISEASNLKDSQKVCNGSVQDKKSDQESVENEKLSRLYGGCLLQKKHPVLKTYLEKEQRLYREIASNLEKQEPSEKIQRRCLEVKEILKWNQLALECF